MKPTTDVSNPSSLMKPMTNYTRTMNGSWKQTDVRRCCQLLLVVWMALVWHWQVSGQAPFQPVPVAEPSLLPQPEEAPPTEAPTQSGPSTTLGLLHVAREGGVLLMPLIACSFLLFVFVFERAFSLRRGRVIPKPFIRRFVQQLEEGQLDQAEAMQRCRENNSPMAQLCAAAVMKWGRPSVEVEQAVIDAGERVSSQLRRYLRLFSGISTISPLLGLLGTVVGMIRAFNTIASDDAMGRPDLLASGISQALLTTAAGLLIAIPAIIVHLYFSSRVDRLVMDMDSWGQQVVNTIASDGWRENSTTKRKSKAA